MTEPISPQDQVVLERVWRACATGSLGQARRLARNSHRTYRCTSDRGESLIVRLADPTRSRFALETEVLGHVAATGMVKVPTIRFTGIEAGPDAEVAVMVQDHLPGVALRDFAT